MKKKVIGTSKFNVKKNKTPEQFSDNEMSEDSEDLEGEEDNEGLTDKETSGEEEVSGSDIEEGEGEDDDEDSGSENEDLAGSHKKALAKLEKTDPEFYKFLKENDKNLLDFQSSDEEAEETSDKEEDGVFKPPSKLHVDSEESDFEEDGVERKKGNVISMAMVSEWRDNLINIPSVESISAAVEAFGAALDRVTGDDESEYVVEGSGVFNAIVEMCVLHLQKSVADFLKLSPSMMKHPEKAKKWNKVKSLVDKYFSDLFKLLGGVTSDNIISVLLKHVHSCCGMIVYFHKLTKIALKRLTKLWSTGEETVRVLSYLCILRLCTIKKSNILNSALKNMYIAYIKSSKFVSANTLPQINFMKRSLVDLFSLDPILSYQHAFLYVRQLAIHLRNAVTLHKKESIQSVYNWQYIHSLRLWVDLMCETKDNAELHQLLFPLVQVIIGTLKLIPTAQYIPLRFHCIQMLIKLNREVGVFIPVLPFIVDSLSCCDVNKQHKKVSMKPFDFTFVLRLSKPAMTENGFPDAVVEYVYNFLLEAGAAYSCSISFPDLFVPVTIQLKNVIKSCKTSKYVTKLKQVLIKIEENSKFIANERSKLSLNLNELEKIKAFESEMKLKVPPLLKYWEQVQAVNRKKQLRDAKAAKEDKKKKVKEAMPEEMKYQKIEKSVKRKKTDDGPVEFLPSDESDFEFPEEDESQSDSPPEEIIKKKRKTKKVKKSKVEDIPEIDEQENGIEDDVLEDLNINTF